MRRRVYVVRFALEPRPDHYLPRHSVLAVVEPGPREVIRAVRRARAELMQRLYLEAPSLNPGELPSAKLAGVLSLGDAGRREPAL